MFLIASTGRCGTVAIAHGLNQFSDHEVGHEPNPLLREAWLKHRRRPYWTSAYRQRMAAYGELAEQGVAYGESFRTSNLISNVMRRTGPIPLLVMARDPEGYVLSAHSRQVLSKNDKWDKYRLMPRRPVAGQPLALRIADHWITVNRYLLDAVAAADRSRVVLHQPLAPVIEDWAGFLGVTVTDRPGLDAYLTEKPNSSTSFEEPDGFELVADHCKPMWEELQARAS